MSSLRKGLVYCTQYRHFTVSTVPCFRSSALGGRLFIYRLQEYHKRTRVPYLSYGKPFLLVMTDALAIGKLLYSSTKSGPRCDGWLSNGLEVSSGCEW